MIGKRLRSAEKDAVVAQVLRDGFAFAGWNFSLLLSLKTMKTFSGKCPVVEWGGGGGGAAAA